MDRRTALHAEATMLRTALIAAPIVTFFGSIALGLMFGAFSGSLTNALTSPVATAFFLGLSIFPAAAYVLVRGILSWVYARQGSYWPTIKAHVIENERHPYYGTGGPFVRFWYVVNGIRYEKYSVQKRAFAIGTDIDVHFDPE